MPRTLIGFVLIAIGVGQANHLAAEEITYRVTGQTLEPFRDEPDPLLRDPWSLGGPREIEWSFVLPTNAVDSIPRSDVAGFGLVDVSLTIEGIGTSIGSGSLTFSDDVLVALARNDVFSFNAAAFTFNGVSSFAPLSANIASPATFTFAEPSAPPPVWNGPEPLRTGSASSAVAGPYARRNLAGAVATATALSPPVLNDWATAAEVFVSQGDRPGDPSPAELFSFTQGGERRARTSVRSPGAVSGSGAVEITSELPESGFGAPRIRARAQTSQDFAFAGGEALAFQGYVYRGDSPQEFTVEIDLTADIIGQGGVFASMSVLDAETFLGIEDFFGTPDFGPDDAVNAFALIDAENNFEAIEAFGVDPVSVEKSSSASVFPSTAELTFTVDPGQSFILATAF